MTTLDPFPPGHPRSTGPAVFLLVTAGLLLAGAAATVGAPVSFRIVLAVTGVCLAVFTIARRGWDPTDSEHPVQAADGVLLPARRAPGLLIGVLTVATTSAVLGAVVTGGLQARFVWLVVVGTPPLVLLGVGVVLACLLLDGGRVQLRPDALVRRPLLPVRRQVLRWDAVTSLRVVAPDGLEVGVRDRRNPVLLPLIGNDWSARTIAVLADWFVRHPEERPLLLDAAHLDRWAPPTAHDAAPADPPADPPAAPRDGAVGR